MPNEAELYYFDGRGKMEFIRLMFAAAGVPTKHAAPLTEAEQFEQLKRDGLLLYGQVPLVKWEGKTMVQTGAIVRYIARKCGLYGKTEDDCYDVDKLTEGTRDCMSAFMTMGFVSEEKFKEDTLKAKTRYLPIFEKILSGCKSGFLVGDSLTMADVGLFEPLLAIEELNASDLETYPNLKAFLVRMKALPQFAAYLPKRPKPNNSKYCEEVARVLQWKK